MAPSRRLSNGRSPLVNQQRQITSFFTPNKKSDEPSSVSPPLSSKQTPNSNPNPNSTPISNLNSSSKKKEKKPLLVIGGPSQRSPISDNTMKTPESAKKLYKEDVVGKRIRVYWPLDHSWYEGYVKSFDDLSGKHLIQYDDAEEEVLDLNKEKIEWVEEEVKSFRRLKRNSGSEKSVPQGGDGSKEGRKSRRLNRNLVSEKLVFDDEDDDDDEGEREDDSADEDWGKNSLKETANDEDSEEIDLVDEDEEEDKDVGTSKRTQGKKSTESKKRKKDNRVELGSGKKNKSSGNQEFVHQNVGEPLINTERGRSPDVVNNILTADVAERFGMREAEKLRFLGVGRRDAKRRQLGDLNFDNRTLYLPPDFLKSLSEGQRQWWEFKSKHMDKVLFFKMGKFYELFEMDAHVGAKELDLQYMKGEQPHVGFPEKNFTANVEKLAKKGYRVLVVEQTETPEQLEIRRKEKGSKDKVVKREVCAVITKGTLTEGEIIATNPDASYLMAVTESFSDSKEASLIIGVCVVDVSTSKFILGQFGDDSERNSLCALLTELRPVEIIKPAKVLSAESERVLLRHTRNPLVNDLVPDSEFWNASRTVDEVRDVYKRLKDQPVYEDSIVLDSNTLEDHASVLPDVLSELVDAGENGTSALSAFGGCLFYLRQALLDETLLRFAKFELLPCSGFRDLFQKPYMILDSAAIVNLEIFENNRNGSSSGTLYAQLNHCVTAFGKRLLKSWLARPLYHPRSIKERQDAVASLRGDAQSSVLEFRKELSRLPDMERLLSRLFARCEANGRNANKVVLYEDAAKRKLHELISALRGCELLAGACSSLSVVLNNVESTLVCSLLTSGIPDAHSVINDFKEAFDWVEADRTGRIIPHEGVDKEYDSACKILKEVESCLTSHLKEQRKVLGDASINYVTIGKDLYLLEVPESLRGSIPRDYELRSSKKGFLRYWTPQIKKLLGELSLAEAEKESKLKSILQRLIGRFCEHHLKWRQLVSAAAELDALISLSIASDYYEENSCQPTILSPPSSGEVPCLSARGLGHPVLRSDALGKGAFVPNDITIGGARHASFLLLTGPNMGGKSTLLRQVCMAVILAQLGADVPAEDFNLSPVDRIFVRMGATDNIMAGQSTFLTELSETASMLSSATCNSLVVLDELGRGTSTSDGQAIAESVLDHFVHNVNCRGLFSTHYHRLAVDYEKDPQVALCHMACQVEEGACGVEQVTFLYRLTPGACPKSYGVNVARLAGLPDSILHKAAAKSKEFEETYGKHRQGPIELSNSGWDKKVADILRDLSNVAKSGCNETRDDGLLTEIHQRARLLLQGS
ncbi:Dna mismatch repair protein muts [Thalictrum thalictroides]|uniref:DNA mismatch repair protein n=1 Tax=Thalictrum thalictroides TaxID=46969 RepID=A0A7J6V8Y6_THATH|nr:Dna mismatch repair protein muts [Thalictrum thalictroides]